ncbi:hypothetical protein E1286_00775 [Nonomuraea terrae]|uniref:Uncharacterized protein n=1 Tax=Nonomuraea terrae TaxID=2530383 RepID=A0A4R4ZFL4_9ACTN|nr:hypothetical protein [Nonomuraea terrae]TDD57283.1 hypothetical protein E1286_00775 [Nonomuraea terrae]
MRAALAFVAALVVLSPVGTAHAASQAYQDVADASHATKQAASFFRSYFTAKSRHDVRATMAHAPPTGSRPSPGT